MIAEKRKLFFLMQIYLMLSCCPCEGRISGIVDAPNACCTLAIPTAIFDQVTALSCSHSIAFPVKDARTCGCIDSTVPHQLECVCFCFDNQLYLPSPS